MFYFLKLSIQKEGGAKNLKNLTKYGSTFYEVSNSLHYFYILLTVIELSGISVKKKNMLYVENSQNYNFLN